MSLVASAAIDQSYEMRVNRDGSSVIEKSMEMNIFGADLNAAELAQVSELCQRDSRFDCSVDGRTIMMAEGFSPGSYYTYRSDFGLLEIEHTLTINRVPTDRFSIILEDILDEAGIQEASGEAAEPIDLLDRAENEEAIGVLRQFGANLTYTVAMPSGFTEARSGALEGTRIGDGAMFDLLDVMDGAQPMVVKSKELNTANIVVASMVVVLAALAITFMRTKPKKRRKK
jgi:hypothetical protein